jgi:MftR C-terminal domain
MTARTTQTACLVASEEWLARGDVDLTQYLDQALRLLATGFGLATPAEPDSARHPEARYFSWPVPGSG